MDANSAETPLLDLLRAVPADARMIYEHDAFHSANIPVGRLCAEAVQEIEALREDVADVGKDAARYRWLRRNVTFHDCGTKARFWRKSASASGITRLMTCNPTPWMP